MLKATLLIPTLNEIEGMKAIMPRIQPSWCEQIIITDGGSTDGTVEYARSEGYTVHLQQKKGLRHAYMEAIPLMKGNILISFSPDGNCIPELIPPLIEKMSEGYDMVIVSRYLGNAKSKDDDILTAFGNWFFTKSVNFLHGGHYTDVMGIYRAIKMNLITELELDQDRWYRTPEMLLRTTLGWEPMLSCRAARRRLKVTEIPGDEPPRIGGERKLQMFRWGAAYYFQFVRDFFCFR